MMVSDDDDDEWMEIESEDSRGGGESNSISSTELRLRTIGFTGTTFNVALSSMSPMLVRVKN